MLTHRIYHQVSFRHLRGKRSTVVVEDEPFNNQVYKTSGRHQLAKTGYWTAGDEQRLTLMCWNQLSQTENVACNSYFHLRPKVWKVYLKMYNWEFVRDNKEHVEIRPIGLLCKHWQQLRPKHSFLSLQQKLLEGVKLDLAVSGKQATCVWLTTQIWCQQITGALFMLELSVWMLSYVFWRIKFQKKHSLNKLRGLAAGPQTIVYVADQQPAKYKRAAQLDMFV